MPKLSSQKILSHFYKYVTIFCLSWITLIAFSFYLNFKAEKKELQELALSEARGGINKDIIFRQWSSGHGGVYVPITTKNPPNPYLSHVDNRDIETTTGQHLTLINPAYMMRQVYELEKEKIGIKGNITSLNPLQPKNAPDDWERLALHDFERGIKEVSSLEMINGEQHLRLMLPLITEKGCLKCHASQGYKEGDIRGGVSASVPIKPYQFISQIHLKTLVKVHLIILSVGLCGIVFGALHLYAQVQKLNKATGSLRKWGQIFEHAQWGIVIIDTKSNTFKLMNSAFAIMHGYSIEELKGKQFTDIMDTEKHNELYLHISNVIQNGYLSFESLNIRKDGTVFPTLLDITTFIDNIDNEKYLVVNIQDITKQHQVDLEIRKLNEELEGRVRLRTTQLEEAHKAMEIDEKSLKFLLLMNQMKFATEKELGQYALEEVVRICNSKVGYLHFVNLDQKSINLFVWTNNTLENCTAVVEKKYPLEKAGIWADCVRERKPVIHNDYQHLPKKHGLPDGHIPIHRHASIPVFDDDKIVAIIGVGNKQQLYNESDTRQLSLFGNSIWHIMKRKRAEEQLSLTVEKSDNANRSKSEFLANMSHEIRTPMNAIMGLSHLALQTDLSQKQRDYLEKIQGSCKSLISIINDILDFSKIEAGKLSIESTEFYLEDVLGNLSRATELRAQEKGIEIIYSIAPDVPAKLVGDPLRVCQILINLVSNAIKFTLKGEIEVNIDSVQEYTNSITLQFSVRDTGVGIAQNDLNRLFRAFRQADTSTTRKHGGTGLGLTICRRLLNLMNGSIEVESKLKKGSVFRFTLNFALPAKRRVIQHSVPGNLQNIRVLVVDDNPTARRILEVILESFSFNVSSAESGEVALLLVQQASDEGLPFKLVFMDWKLNDISGIEIALSIKSNKNLSSIPLIIMVTAYGREEVIQEIEQIDLDGYLFKPVSRSIIFNKIMEVFGEQVAVKKPRHFQRLVDSNNIEKIKGSKVLVVEDNKINQQVAKELIESWGLIVHIAKDGKEAVKIMSEELSKFNKTTLPNRERSQFEAIFMDIQMPEMDGFTATREIRKIEKTLEQYSESSIDHIKTDDNFSLNARHIPIIAMTAHAMTGDREKSLEAGMNDHITKPIDPGELITCLLRWIAPVPQSNPELISLRKKQVTSHEEDIALPENLSFLDIKSGLDRVAGNKKLYRKLLDRFVKDNDQIVSIIKELININDSKNAKFKIHTLKGEAGNIGARSVFKTAKAVEYRITQQDDHLGELLNDLDSQMETLLHSLKEFCDQHPMPIGWSKNTPHNTASKDSKHLEKKIIELVEYCKNSDTRAISVFNQIRDDLAIFNPEQSELLDGRLKNYDYKGGIKILELLGLL